MKKLFLFCSVLSSLLFACEREEISSTPVIHVNQAGFYPGAVKEIVTVNTLAAEFVIQEKASGREVFRGALKPAGRWDGAPDEKSVRVGDFSALKTKGTYVASVEGAGASAPFVIEERVYRDALAAAMKSYYFQRASLAIEAKYGGRWQRAAGHPDNRLLFHAESGRTGEHSSPGGWYDAGDYGKYAVNAGITVWTLLALAEIYPDAVGDDLNIPESGNGRSDLLDEVKYELDWLKTMQDDDGGVFFKVGPVRGWPGFILPEDDRTQRFVIGKSTASTLNFALVMAQAGRLFAPSAPAFAADCADRAERAYAWAEKNPKTPAPTEASGTGAYDDSEFDDEFFAAAAELYAATGKDKYAGRLEKELEKPKLGKPSSWSDLKNLGYIRLALLGGNADAVKKEIIRAADALLEEIKANPYRVPLRAADFLWGSNGVLLNKCLVIAFAHHFTGEGKYLAGLDRAIDYIFGKNATGYSFLTGIGDVTPMKPHHRMSRAMSVVEPVPGLLVGGPNRNREDGQVYDTKSPAKSYLDAQSAFASNEVAINWNAPLVFLLAYLERHGGAARRSD